VIIERKELRKWICEEWLVLFKNGKLDVHKAFEEHVQKYEWLYMNSDYDLIAWQIQNNCFDWEENSWAVAQFCSRLLDPKLYNWKKDSWVVARHCPYLLDPKLYNWEDQSWAVARYCHEHFDSELYNWEKDSAEVAINCSHLLDPKLFNWKKHSWVVARLRPHLLYLRPKKVW